MLKSSTVWVVLILISMAIAPPFAMASRVQEKTADELIFSCEQEIGNPGPLGKFLLYQKPSIGNYRYQLVIEINGCRKFCCDIRSAVSLKTTGAISVLDINDDGYKDVKVLGGQDRKSGHTWYKEWFFDPEKCTFVFQG